MAPDTLNKKRLESSKTSCKLCAIAAGKNLIMLQKLRRKGLQWDAKVFINACRHDKTDVLEWAANNGCPRPALRSLRKIVCKHDKKIAALWLENHTGLFA